METSSQRNLIRKQFLVSESNIVKITKIAEQKQTSVTDVVRMAIDAYDPNDNTSMPELMELVSKRLKEAIESTQMANKKVSETLLTLEGS